MSSGAFDSPISAPLGKLSSDESGPWVLVCGYILIVLSVITIVIKILTRFKATNRLTANDYFILTAATITVTIAEHYGLGRKRNKVSDADFGSFQKSIYAADILLIASMAASQASLTFLVIAINPTRKLLLSCYFLLGYLAVWMIASIFAVSFKCNLPSPWNIDGNKCVDLFALNVGIYSLSILGDLGIVAVPFIMMQKVQVSRTKRFVVSGLFACRLAVPAFTIAMLVYRKRQFNTTRGRNDPTWYALVPQVFAQVMMNASIIAACIPSLKPFLADIKPGLIVVNIPEHELTASFVRHSKSRGNGKRAGTRTGGLSRFASRFGLTSNGGSVLNSSSGSSGMLGEKQKEAVTAMERGYNRPHATKASSKVENDRSDSVKGLTDDIILHTVDYKVEYEDHSDADGFNDAPRGSPRRL
ncbi:hypothetical protein PV08_08963 [Exophiala spinifera]|uniref:Rhodopsin domain-containing protein n=1 Tax=Exophiala spinifera TaxID=91928 RepID=A0A0D1ZLQ6_9EURO|nr:uncharacterized protein PV08_08963 [Exophiala spinifera]KIW13772.1 hypothetical protein PV08_08963 [Exophiala spinifera]